MLGLAVWFALAKGMLVMGKEDNGIGLVLCAPTFPQGNTMPQDTTDQRRMRDKLGSPGPNHSLMPT